MDRALRRGPTLALLLCVSVVPAVSADEGWVVSVEGAGAVPLSTPLRDRFHPGPLLSGAGLRSLGPRLLAGVRLRAGFLLDGPAPADATLANPGAGGLASALLVARYRPLANASAASRAHGAWVELGAGAAATGPLVRATAEVGLGWNFPWRTWAWGPAVRYLHVVQPQHALGGADARMVVLGVEFTVRDLRAMPLPAPPPAPDLPPRPEPPAPADTDGDGITDDLDRCPLSPEDKDGFEDEDGCPDPDNDKDGILDAADKCPNEAEVVNAVDDDDGCPDEGLIEVKNGRIVLDERVLFDKNRARVKRRGRPTLKAVLELWRQQGDWERLVIEGHTDVRGPDRYNQWLSETRARRVREALIQQGLPADKVEVAAFGRNRPVAEGHDDGAHQRNRRVEFVIERKAPSSAQGSKAP